MSSAAPAGGGGAAAASPPRDAEVRVPRSVADTGRLVIYPGGECGAEILASFPRFMIRSWPQMAPPLPPDDKLIWEMHANHSLSPNLFVLGLILGVVESPSQLEVVQIDGVAITSVELAQLRLRVMQARGQFYGLVVPCGPHTISPVLAQLCAITGDTIEYDPGLGRAPVLYTHKQPSGFTVKFAFHAGFKFVSRIGALLPAAAAAYPHVAAGISRRQEVIDRANAERLAEEAALEAALRAAAEEAQIAEAIARSEAEAIARSEAAAAGGGGGAAEDRVGSPGPDLETPAAASETGCE